MRTEDVLNQIDQALDDWEVGPDAMRCNAPPEEARTWPGLRTSHFVTVAFTADTVRIAAQFEEAMARVAAIYADATDAAAERALAAYGSALRPEFCLSPDREPAPLSIDGHAYHRRRRNRRSR